LSSGWTTGGLGGAKRRKKGRELAGCCGGGGRRGKWPGRRTAPSDVTKEEKNRRWSKERGEEKKNSVGETKGVNGSFGWKGPERKAL